MPTSTYTIKNQFSFHQVIDIPCDSTFEGLLNQIGILKRPFDALEGVKKTNEYGEIVMTYPDAQIVDNNLKVRIDPIRQRGEVGIKTRTQGGEVFATFRIFTCPGIDIRENDIIQVYNREYQVLLVEPYSGSANLHHNELMARRVDNI